MFTGVCTALITPFKKDLTVDYEKYEKLLDFQLKNQVDALLVCGTTGEPATMSNAEKNELIKFTIEYVNKRVPVIVGCGSNSTEQAIKAALNAEKLGADGLLMVTPFYNKCSQEGLFRHYEAIDKVISKPVIVYNVPGRTGVNIQPATAKRLSKLTHIKAIKEASGNMDQIVKLKHLINNEDIILYSGDDALTLPMLALGCNGVISVAANIIPKQIHDMVVSFNKGDVQKARNIHDMYIELMNSLFLEVNPIPVKKAASLLGFSENLLRLPLCEMSDENAVKLEKVMKDCNLI